MAASYVLRVRDRFEAAHHLTSYQGAPEAVHGHSWQVEVVLEADQLDDEGMAFDFVEIRRHLRELVGRYDHRHINEIAPFDELSPTTERLARWFHEELAARLPAARLVETSVWEGPDCTATFRPAASGPAE